MSRYKKYKSGKALQKAIDNYFDSISRLIPVNVDNRSDGLPQKVKSESIQNYKIFSFSAYFTKKFNTFAKQRLKQKNSTNNKLLTKPKNDEKFD